MPNSTHESLRVNQRSWMAGFFLILASAVVLRGVEAGRKALWLDELHTLHIARAESASGTIERLLPDFHAPLFFLAAHATKDVDPHAQRIWTILGSLMGFVALWLWFRSAGVGRAGLFAAMAILGALPFQIQYGAELRPYSWLLTSVLSLNALALMPVKRRGLRTILIAAVTAFGLYTHYLMVLPAAALFLVRMVFSRKEWPSRESLFHGLVLGALAFSPWIAFDERWLFEDPGRLVRNELEGVPIEETPGLLDRVRTSWPMLRAELLSLLPRTLLPSQTQLGPVAGKVALIGAALLALSIFLGVTVRVARRKALTAVPSLWAGLFASTLTAILLTAVSVVVWQRVALQYFTVAAMAWPILGALAAESLPVGRWRQALLGSLVLGTLIAGTAHVLGHPREDYRSAVSLARSTAKGSPSRLTAVLRQPDYYSDAIVYDLYGKDLQAVEPEAVPGAEEGGGLPVVVITRAMPVSEAASNPKSWHKILSGRRLRSRARVGALLEVLVFEDVPPRPPR